MTETTIHKPPAVGGGLLPEHGEFEREPVPPRAWLGLGSFVGMYAGEHVAGTELMIGPLFLASGVAAWDLVAGLLVGNLLAVLSWMLFPGPIATRARLTLYYQLEKICGRNLVALYNLANGVMFCFLAGAMITVSATAVGVWVKFPMPGLNDLYPNSVGWVAAVLVVGGLIAVVAAYGYESVARFANVAAPWMVLVFLAFGIIGPEAARGDVAGRRLDDRAGADLEGGRPAPRPDEVQLLARDVLRLVLQHGHAHRHGRPVGAAVRPQVVVQRRLRRRHVHRPLHGLDRASLLYAVQLQQDPANTDVLPGPMADRAAGFAGLLCVIIAGWTTANPTIYRAGLAFQAIVPRRSRFAVTLFTGLIATVAGMFPAIAMKLLGFVAIYGMILMPMGAVVFVDFWLLHRFGGASDYAARSGTSFNWAAGLTWLLTLAACMGLVLARRASRSTS